ncbi:DUF1750-domain-containing protein [Aureobasidium pullulans]|uniref:DUF1750-domain-containing protein n=1 Tax=Aureobasidium pullulans TaxID=5580 RepID=A0A4S9A8K2_AURPU|nr:DUF1750-domain-containing protein [Aureobasidium pullulans]
MQASMADPSFGVPAQLLPHVHLISGHKYPFSPQLNIDGAYTYLFDAPKVVKQVAPMSWQYISAPQDGTVFLTWIGGRMQNQFPTDGYVWVDPEQRFTQDFGGYTLEVAVHNSGYRPGADSVTCHARRRYRFMSKNPTVHALPPDPSLWLVHYSQADPQHCFPTSQLPLSPQSRQQLAERQWIESQGRLDRQDFMLHDREKWPQLNMPGRAAVPGVPAYNQSAYQQSPMAHIGNPRFSGNFYQQAQQGHTGPSPAKRARQHAPAHIPASAAALMAQDTSIEDEENVLLGDLLDHLTQRDISLTRYMQHHDWMDEVYSSPFATGQIVPMDLGFGLMGELAGLTEGLFDTPNSTLEKAESKAKDTSTAYKKISSEQLQEFEKRVQAHKEKEQSEIARMKEEHARRMDSLRKSKGLVKAEKKLRNASWKPSGSTAEFWRLEKTNDQDATQIIEQVEELLGGSIQAQKEATMVSEGGYRKEEKRTPPADMDMAGTQMDGAGSDAAQSLQSASGASAEPAPAPLLQSEQPQLSTQEAPAAPQVPPQQHLQSVAPSVPDTNMENMETMDTGNFSLPDDMELDTGNFNFDTPKTDVQTPGTSNWPGQQQQAPSRPQQQANPQPDTSNQTSGGDLYGGGDANFGEFDTGDGLIDFDGGAGEDIDFSMDNSAFGDAFHGTEAHGQDEGQ